MKVEVGPWQVEVVPCIVPRMIDDYVGTLARGEPKGEERGKKGKKRKHGNGDLWDEIVKVSPAWRRCGPRGATVKVVLDDSKQTMLKIER